MMKKIILISILVLALISFAYGIDEGDLITQEQLNNLNIEDYPYQQILTFLKCSQDSAGAQIFMDNTLWYFVEFSCLDLIRTKNPELYIVFRDDSYAYFKVRDWVICTNNYSIEACRVFFRRVLNSYVRAELDDTVDNVLRWQDDDTEGNVTGIGNIF